MIFCAASATAIPPIPTPARSVETFVPKIIDQENRTQYPYDDIDNDHQPGDLLDL